MNKKRKEKKPLRIRLFYFFIVCFALLILIASYSEFNKATELLKIEKKYKNEIAQEKINNINLKNELEYINTDTYIEKAAREKLGLIKQNEIIYYRKEEHK